MIRPECEARGPLKEALHRLCRMLYIPLAIPGITDLGSQFLVGRASSVLHEASIAYWNSLIFTPSPSPSLPSSLASSIIASDLQTRHLSVRSPRLNKSPFTQSAKGPSLRHTEAVKTTGRPKLTFSLLSFSFSFPFFLFSYLGTSSLFPSFLPLRFCKPSFLPPFLPSSLVFLFLYFFSSFKEISCCVTTLFLTLSEKKGFFCSNGGRNNSSSLLPVAAHPCRSFTFNHTNSFRHPPLSPQGGDIGSQLQHSPTSACVFDKRCCSP